MSQKRTRREFEADARRQHSPFVLYGTPLPPLDENIRDDGSYQPIWKQEVTDDRGRKRLHGAFTGGFSAGYFNSVGSKEGWTPSTFVSSRSNRAKDAKDFQQQKVDDFMDEEDLREREESRQIASTDAFAGFRDESSKDVLDNLFKPVQDSMGEKLLNKMGWKKGQGIGPRVLRKIDPNDNTSETREFPPTDTPLIEFNQKNDTKGLGFGDDDKAQIAGQSKGNFKNKNDGDSEEDSVFRGLSFSTPASTTKKSKRPSGIGVGSLNDTGSDDDDPYEMGPKISYTRVIGGDKKPKKAKSSTTNANPMLKSQPVFKSKKAPAILANIRKCHDGKPPPRGFVLAEPDELNNFGSMSLSDEKFKPPDVPEDWQPSRVVQDPNTVGQEPASFSRASNPVHQTSQSRANILKEKALPTKSVFDYLTPAARDRLAAASGRMDLPPALGEAPPTSTGPSQSSESSKEPTLNIPHLDPTTAMTALTRLRKDKNPEKPYADNLPKQGRYKDFLRFSSDPKPRSERVPPLRDPTHKEDTQHLDELNEFVTTANLFRPVTGFLASRFTSAASAAAAADASSTSSFKDPNPSSTSATATATGKDPSTASHDNTANTESEPTENLLRSPFEKPKDPAEEAARMGMFGIATRSSFTFFPTKLLCKRFGVDVPMGD